MPQLFEVIVSGSKVLKTMDAAEVKAHEKKLKKEKVDYTVNVRQVLEEVPAKKGAYIK